MALFIRKTPSYFGNFLCHTFLSPNYVTKTQVAGMISKLLRDKDFKRPPPFDYKNNNYNLFTAMFDDTTWRFDENSRIVVVDGPVASGKAKFAQKVAEEFDLLYFPHAHMDMDYVNECGFDQRMINDKLPPRLRTIDVHEFLANPMDERRCFMQNNFYKIRFRQYLDALNHVFSTGQGVVMDRCVYSDIVFLETYVKLGIFPQSYKKYYYLVANCMKPDLLRPHLVIYLDTPVDVVSANLKKRNNPVEINSPVNQPDALKEFENIYKFQYLKEISKHAELLVYDWSEEIDTEIVVEDIERLNLDTFDKDDPRMKDWRMVDESTYNFKRTSFSGYKRDLLERWFSNIPYYDCEEILFSGEENLMFMQAYVNIPGNKYQKGYNTSLGDEVLFKM